MEESKMDTLEFFRRLFAAAHRQLDASMKDTTAEQFNWVPCETANPISATFIHCLNSEDFFVQVILQGKRLLWEEGGYMEKTGVKKTPGYGGGWEEFRHMQVEIGPLLDYQKTVWAGTDVYLQTLTPEDLERKVKFAGGERSVADMLILSAGHTFSHAGEISALKGVQGVKGLPY
jgi:uncharacterized damage-inducible protein DinB